MIDEDMNQRFWMLLWDSQNRPDRKWKRLSDFRLWVESWGGRIKTNTRKRKGYVVRTFHDKFSYEIPEDFVSRCLVLDELP